MALSDDIFALRVWFGAYMLDGVALTPNAVKGALATLDELHRQARDYEAIIMAANEVMIAGRTEQLRRKLPPAPLSEEQLADPKIAILYPGPPS